MIEKLFVFRFASMNVDLSLDDILRAKQRRSGSGSRGRGNFSQKRGGGRPQYKEAQGKWGHDGYFEAYGGRGVGVPRTTLSAGGTGGPCRVNIANLHNVSIEDLEELFSNYPHDGVTMHYDEAGQPVGTADIHFKKRPSFAAKMIKDCDGMRIDGRPLKFFLLGPRPATSFVQRVSRPTGRFESKFNKVGGKFNKTRGGRVEKQSGDRKQKRTPMTEDQLNKELDAYMTKK